MPDPVAASSPSPSGNAGGSASTPPASGNVPAATGAGAGTGENTTPGARPGETTAQTAKRLSRVEKVNGKEVTLEATEDELWASHRREKAVHDNARKVAEARKAHEAEVKKWEDQRRAAEEDPFHAHRKNPNFNELEFLQERTHRLLTEQNRDPRDLELSTKDREIQKLQKQISERETQEKQHQERQQEDAELRRDGAVFAAALKKGNLPQDDLTLDMMAKAYYTAQDEQDLDLTPDELAVETRRMMSGALDNCADKMEDDQLLEAFPKLAKKMHRALVAKYQKMKNGGQQRTAEPPAPVAPTGQKTDGPKQLTEREQFREMEKASGRRILRGV